MHVFFSFQSRRVLKLDTAGLNQGKPRELKNEADEEVAQTAVATWGCTTVRSQC